jgi:mannose-6-phosphate isomerase-like protein (cupin superfamily)
MKTTENFGLSSMDALEKLQKSGSDKINLSRYGNLSFDIYKPKGKDNQQPHDKDEIYMVISGSGVLSCNGTRTSCKQGDILFVPARMEHRFEGFSDDFSTWAIFTNPTIQQQATV